MIWQNELLRILRSRTLIIRALQGAGIAFVLITIFILGAIAGDANFGTWIYVPMIATTLAGAGGGVFYCLMDLLRIQGGWKKVVANVASVLVYFIALYFTLIVGLSLIGAWH